jgi:hypothetical protein
MKLVEALQLARAMGKRDGEPMVVSLACGFTPLHVQTFLGAHLAASLPT